MELSYRNFFLNDFHILLNFIFILQHTITGEYGDEIHVTGAVALNADVIDYPKLDPDYRERIVMNPLDLRGMAEIPQLCFRKLCRIAASCWTILKEKIFAIHQRLLMYYKILPIFILKSIDIYFHMEYNYNQEHVLYYPFADRPFNRRGRDHERYRNDYRI